MPNVGVVLTNKPIESKKYDYEFDQKIKDGKPNKVREGTIIDKSKKPDFYIDSKNRYYLVADLEIVPSKMEQWQFIKWTYEAIGGERDITIGNFIHENRTRVKKVKYRLREEPMLNNSAYVLIDIIFLELIHENEEIPPEEFKEPFIISDVNFEFNSHILAQTGYKFMDSLVKVLKYDNELYQLNITGHTDNVGTSEYNEILGYKRAEMVSEYLISLGFNNNALFIESNGERNPITSNKTDLGREKNRRVEIYITRELDDSN
jgi:OOP family OmpA-OmpF porin